MGQGSVTLYPHAVGKIVSAQLQIFLLNIDPRVGEISRYFYIGMNDTWLQWFL